EWKHTTQTEFDIAQVTSMPRVDIIYGSMDMSPALIDASASGAKGIVIAGVGNGNMNKASVDAAANAVKKGVVVVRSSRVTTGNVGRNVELDDDKLGFIASDELNPQKARILLSLALLKPHTKPELQHLLYSYRRSAGGMARVMIWIELIILLTCIVIGARIGGMALG